MLEREKEHSPDFGYIFPWISIVTAHGPLTFEIMSEITSGLDG